MRSTKRLEEAAPGCPVGPLLWTLYLLATVQVVCCYLRNVPSYMQMFAYENGTDRMPFQGRVMMMLLLRWAHGSALLISMAAEIDRLAPWFLPHMIAETVLEMGIDTVAIAVTGAMAIRIYRAASRTRLLTLWVYPLLLMLCVCFFLLHATQNLRYYYDLPGLMFFTAGLYLIFFRRSPALFAAVFLLGTVNRETMLLLLPAYMLAWLSRPEGMDWRRLKQLEPWAVVAPLAAAWVGWHLWMGQMFRQNPSEFSWRIFVNLGLLLVPLAWPQLVGGGGFLLFLLFYSRGKVRNPVLRGWLWLLPAWLVVMLFYGIFIETRIFGELAGYFASVTALIAEESILADVEKQGGPLLRPAHSIYLVENDARALPRFSGTP